MKNFKLDRKGFTLIELLAVITILGILMLILIPSVSRIIENSRKNTFLTTAKNYANAVRDEWAADNLYCTGEGQTNKLASSLNTGTFYVFIKSDSGSNFALDSKYTAGTFTNDANALTNFQQLINSGGRSSWGNNDIIGYVKVVVHLTGQASAVTHDKQMAYDYYVELIDSAYHGITDTGKQVGDLLRADVLTTGATATAPVAFPKPSSAADGDYAAKKYSCIVS